MLSAADALLLNQRRGVQDTVLPSKLIKYLAAGRAIIAAVNEQSETASYLLQAECGAIVPSENPSALSDAVKFYSKIKIVESDLG